MYVVSVKDLLYLTEDDDNILAYLQYKKLVLSEYICPTCASKCGLCYDEEDNYFFRCFASQCKFQCSLHLNTWFANTKLSFADALNLMYGFVTDMPIIQCSYYFEVSKPTVVNWYNFCREICIDFCLRKQEKIGGPDKIVEIDECKFVRQKDQQEWPVKQHWVFGGIERRPGGKFFLVPVETREAEALIQVIKDHILPGTTIVSDVWKAYCELNQEGFKEFTINHSVHFKDPETGACTNTVEERWYCVKRNIPTSQCSKVDLLGYLAKHMWNTQFKKEDRFEAFVDEVADQFTPYSW